MLNISWKAAPNEASRAAGVNSEQDNDLMRAGAVYIFIRNGGDWSLQAYLKASNAEQNDLLVTLSV